MIYMFFFLKFKAQLRRTHPELIRQLDDSLIRAITDAGGKITGDRFVISAIFKEDAVGFWLGIYILIENLIKSMQGSREFFGFSLVVSSKLPDYPEMLSRFLANHSGIFVNDKVAGKLIAYASFDKPSKWLNDVKKRKYGCGSYYKIRELKVFKKSVRNKFDLQNDASIIFHREQGKNILITASRYSFLRGGLSSYYKDLNGDFPPLTICFGSTGLGALVDIWSPGVRSLSGKTYEEIDNLWELLFRERIRDEVSDYIIRSIKRFLNLVFEHYYNAALTKKCVPVLILENVHLAGNTVIEILFDVLNVHSPGAKNNEYKKNIVILGIGEDEIPKEKQAQWSVLFNKIKNIDSIPDNQISYPRLSYDIWEIIYSISLFSRYFSSELFQKLFEEAEINQITVTKAFSILNNLGFIDNLNDPRPVSRHFEEYAGKILGERRNKVNELVRGRLLDWAGRRNINPCFRLLTIIAGLKGAKQIDELLLLKSFSSDIINETVSGIESAMKSGQFEDLVTVRAAAIRYIFRTSMALNAGNGNENEMEKVFDSISAENINNDCELYPVLKAQILVNLGAYYFGRSDKKSAAERAKEAILLCQSKNSYCLASAYRIFSLVYLSKQQIGETIEYLSFALSNAQRSGNYQEMAVSAYYSAAAQFLYGDIYNAAKFARKSIEQSLASGLPDWADRSRFLEGRIEFELGHYRKARDIFDAIYREPYGRKTEQKDSLLSAWIYRSVIYSNDPKMPKPEGANHDADLFEIEASYLAGDYQKTVDLSNSLNNPFSKDNFLFSEKADWRSGFSQCEHLYFTQGEIQNRMINLFNSLAKVNLSSHSEEALQGIQQILRDEKLCEMDPWDAVYFYAKYRILEQTNATPVDLSTAVSMAFKRLQRRAGRIEDIETRRQYLNGPRWNNELSRAAREFKLI